MTDSSKTAVILFNLGGPDSLEAVKPFLFNLFNDKAIIRAPNPMRWMIAKLISSRRAPVAREIYRHMGGKSPIVELTDKQAKALEKKLAEKMNAKVFVAMRYWKPFAEEVVKQVKQYAPDNVVLLPLYPQFSTTTTASSLREWKQLAKKYHVKAPAKAICCYPQENHFLAAHVELVQQAYWKASTEGKVRILFSAHGLPEKIITGGDPYAWQVEQTVKDIMNILTIEDAEHVVCYQSRVGPLKWIGPSTEEELKRAGEDGVSVVVVPVAFVSEHSETLVELDIEYAKLAKEWGVKAYERVPALGVNEHYIESLAALTHEALGSNAEICSHNGARNCPQQFKQCPCTAEVLDD